MDTKTDDTETDIPQTLFQIKVDRQIRPVLLILTPTIRIKGLDGPIFALRELKTSNVVSQLFNTISLPPKSSILEFNGTKWARSQCFHLKLFIKPQVFIDKLLYPQWTVLSQSDLSKKFSNAFTDTYINYLENNIKEIEKIDSPKHIPSLHGYLFHKIVIFTDLSSQIFEFETFLFKHYSGSYNVYVYNYNESKCVLLSVVDEKIFFNKHPQVDQIEPYIDKPRYYYKDFQPDGKQPTFRDFFFPTKPYLSIVTKSRDREIQNSNNSSRNQNLNRKSRSSIFKD